MKLLLLLLALGTYGLNLRVELRAPLGDFADAAAAREWYAQQFESINPKYLYRYDPEQFSGPPRFYTGDEDLPAGPPAIAVNPVGAEGDLARPAPEPLPAEVPDDGVPDVAGPAAEGRDPIGPAVLVTVLVLAVGEWLWVYGVRPWRRRRRAARRAEVPTSDATTPVRAPERVP